MPEVRPAIKDVVLQFPDKSDRPHLSKYLNEHPRMFVNVDHVLQASAEELIGNTVDCTTCSVRDRCAAQAHEGDIMACCGMVGVRLATGDEDDWLYVDCKAHKFRGEVIQANRCEGCDPRGYMADEAISYDTECHAGFLFTVHAVMSATRRQALYRGQRAFHLEEDARMRREYPDIFEEDRTFPDGTVLPAGKKAVLVKCSTDPLRRN